MLDRQKLNIRLNLLISTSLIIVLVILGTFLYQSRKKQIEEEIDIQMEQQIDELTLMYTLMIKNNQVKVNEAMVLANEFFSSLGEIKEDPGSYVSVQAINRDVEKEWKVIKLNKWYQKDTLVQFSIRFVDEMTKLSNAAATIYQKIPEGYIRIATSVRDSKGERIVGTFIPNSSPVVETIERGLTYKAKALIVDNWYLSAYQPLFINGEIKGMLFVGVKEIDKNTISDLFKINRMKDIAFPYLIGENGEYLIHPKFAGKRIGKTSFFKKFIRSSSQVYKIRYLTGENDVQIEKSISDISKKIGIGANKEEAEWFRDYYKFEETARNYIAITLKESYVLDKLRPFRNKILIAGFTTLMLMVFITTLIVKPITTSINELVQKVGWMSQGLLVDKIEKIDKSEIGNIASSINSLIKGLRSYANFARQIGEGNLDAEFSTLSEKDVLGNSLLIMRNNLKKAELERQRRNEENEKQKWIDKGLSQFNEILRLFSQDIEKLSYSIISNLTKYLNANVGGVFLLENEEFGEGELRLVASYAYNRERNLKKTMNPQVGLPGRCMQEKKILYFTEIPDDYLRITSGLGHQNPNNIVLIPLKDNDEVLGLIEVASFNLFNDTAVLFIEKVASSISKTIAATKINARTAKLLAKSRQQSEELAAQEEEMRQNLEELQATQEASMRRETELTGLLNALHTSTLVIEFDMEGYILNINDSFLNLMRIQREQLIGKNQDVLIPIEEVEDYKKIRERLNAGETVSKVTHFTYLNMNLWLQETYTPILDEEGIPYKFIDIATDITENVNREQKIKNQNQEIQENQNEIQQNFEKIQDIQTESARHIAEKTSILKALYESTLIAEYDMNMNLLKMNKRMLELFEVNEDQIAGTKHNDFTTINEKSRLYKLFVEDLKQAKIRTIEEYIKLPSGKRFWLSQTYTPILDEDNKPYKILNIATDITSKKIPNV